MAGPSFSENALLVIGGTATLAVHAMTGASLSGLTETLLGTRGLRAGLRSVRGGAATAVFDEVVREVEALWTGPAGVAEQLDAGAARDARIAAERFFAIAEPEQVDVAGCALNPDRLTDRIVDAARHRLPTLYGVGQADAGTRVHFLALVTHTALKRLLSDTEFVKYLAPAITRRTLETLEEMSTTVSDTNARVRTLQTAWIAREDATELWALSLEKLLGRRIEPSLSELVRASADVEERFSGGRGDAHEQSTADNAERYIEQIRQALDDGELDKAEALAHHRHAIENPGDGYWARVYAFVLQRRGSHERAANAYEKAAGCGGALAPFHMIECRLEQAKMLLNEADGEDTWEPYERALSVIRDHALPTITDVDNDADRAHFLGQAASVLGIVGSAREDVAIVREARDVLDAALGLPALRGDGVRFSFELNRATADLDIGIFEGNQGLVSAGCRRVRALLDETPSGSADEDLLAAATAVLARGLLWRGHTRWELEPLFEAVRRCKDWLDAMPPDAARRGSLERAQLRARLVRAQLIGFGERTIDGECVFGTMEMADVLRALDSAIEAAEPSSPERVAFRTLRAGALLASAKLDRSAGPETGNYRIAVGTIDRSVDEYRALVKDLSARGRARFAYGVYGGLANALSTRGRWSRSIGDLETAIQLWQDELDDARHAPCEGHRMILENNRGSAMIDAFEFGSQNIDLDEAVRCMVEAMARATPEMDARDRQRLHRNLGRALLSRARTRHSPKDAGEAAKALSRALELLPLTAAGADDTYRSDIVAELNQARQLAQ